MPILDLLVMYFDAVVISRNSVYQILVVFNLFFDLIFRIEMIVRVASVVPPVAQIGAKGLAAILTEEAKNSLGVSDAGALTTTGMYQGSLKTPPPGGRGHHNFSHSKSRGFFSACNVLDIDFLTDLIFNLIGSQKTKNTKGQIISKGFFGIHEFSQKTKERIRFYY